MREGNSIWIGHLLVDDQLADWGIKSTSEALRKIQEKSIYIDGELVIDKKLQLPIRVEAYQVRFKKDIATAKVVAKSD